MADQLGLVVFRGCILVALFGYLLPFPVGLPLPPFVRPCRCSTQVSDIAPFSEKNRSFPFSPECLATALEFLS